MMFWRKKSDNGPIGPVSQSYILAAKILGVDLPDDEPVSLAQAAMLTVRLARRLRSLEEKIDRLSGVT